MNDKVRALEALRDYWRQQYDRLFDPDKVQIGDFTYGIPIVRTWGEDTKLTIGKFCSIGGNVKIYLGGNHHNDWLTTFPFNAILPEVWGDIDGGVAATKGDVVIGNDVWIADNAVIMSGVTIGDGATIANGAVVTKNVYPYTLVVGNPASVKTVFYHKEGISGLRWWDWPLEKLAEAIPVLMSKESGELATFDRVWRKYHE